MDRRVVTRLEPYRSSDPDYELEIGSEYCVYALEFMWGGIWLYIETYGRDYPHPYPIEYFEIVDSSLPDDWLFSAPYRASSKAIASYAEWVNDPHFYEKLLNDSPKELAVYESKRPKVDYFSDAPVDQE